MGAAVCIGGLAVLVLADGAGARHSGYKHALLGDVLVLIGALLYAGGNVAQEHLLGETQHRMSCAAQSWSTVHGLPDAAMLVCSFLNATRCLTGNVSNAKLLALLGAFGSLFSLVQAGIIEHSALREAPWDWQVTAEFYIALSEHCHLRHHSCL
jgi:drug/metabolite transporter (DMT)-like permease